MLSWVHARQEMFRVPLKLNVALAAGGPGPLDMREGFVSTGILHQDMERASSGVKFRLPGEAA